MDKNYNWKIGNADYLPELENQTFFGWIHTKQNRDITDKVLQDGLIVFAWEKMFGKKPPGVLE